ncbi:MAG: hypothetical protein Q6373_011665 [Candidatus Sigynarchaeota archaeon]
MEKNATFQFFSGGRHHFRGFGEWIFSIERNGRLHVEHHVADQKKHDKFYTLSPAENDKCWACIDALKLPSMKGSSRPGVPDEPEYRFLLDDGSCHVEVKIWANDAQKRPDVKKLVDLIKEIIHRYVKKDVVI